MIFLRVFLWGVLRTSQVKDGTSMDGRTDDRIA